MRRRRKIEWRCSKSLERKFAAREEKFSIESSRRAGVESSRTKSLKASARSRRGKIKKFFDRRRARDNITRRVALTNERVCTLVNWLVIRPRYKNVFIPWNMKRWMGTRISSTYVLYVLYSDNSVSRVKRWLVVIYCWKWCEWRSCTLLLIIIRTMHLLLHKFVPNFRCKRRVRTSCYL